MNNELRRNTILIRRAIKELANSRCVWLRGILNFNPDFDRILALAVALVTPLSSISLGFSPSTFTLSTLAMLSSQEEVQIGTKPAEQASGQRLCALGLASCRGT